MNGLSYLLRTTIKNSIKDLKTHPAKLVLVLFFVVMMAVVIVSGSMAGIDVLELRDPAELSAMVLGLYIAIFLLSSLNGFSSGASFYSMPDVQMLFPAPISPRRILIYGLVKQMGTSLFVGFFLLFQYSWLHQLYNLSIPGLILILLGYCMVMFCSQLTAMAIYTFTSGNPRAKRVVKALLYLLVLAAVAYIFLPLISDRSDILGTIVSRANAPLLQFFPVAGWAQAFSTGALAGQLLPLLCGLAGVALYVVGFVLLISKSRSDFYEDVLQATEVSYSAITAKKEGKMNDLPQGKVRLGKTGIGRGWGAGVFFYKHMLENRRSKFFLLDNTSMLFIIICIFTSFFTRGEGLLPVFFISVYMQLFSSALGRWVRELTLPYVYMIPVSPFVKLVNVCKENVYKICVEALLLFIPVGIITQASIPDILACMVARVGFGLLFMAGNILTERILGSLSSKVLILSFYFLIMLLLCAPGLILGFVLNFVLFADTLSLPFILLVGFGWNLIASALVTFFCRDILNYAELNNR